MAPCSGRSTGDQREWWSDSGVAWNCAAGHQPGESALHRVGMEREGELLIARKAVSNAQIAGIDMIVAIQPLAGGLPV